MSTERPDDVHPVDDAVDQAWRTASSEEPAPHLDAAIIAAARVEADRARERPARHGMLARRPASWMYDRWRTWQPLAAAAAVAGLALVLVQTIPRDRDVAPPVTIEKARPDMAAHPPAAESATATLESGGPQTAAPLTGQARDAAPAAPAAPPPAPETRPATAAEARSREAGMAEDRVGAEAAPSPRSRAERAAPAPAGIATPAEREFAQSRHVQEAAKQVLAPEAWAARIEALLDSGEHEAAAEELRSFRAAYTDADGYLPEALRDWAATVE